MMRVTAAKVFCLFQCENNIDNSVLFMKTYSKNEIIFERLIVISLDDEVGNIES